MGRRYLERVQDRPRSFSTNTVHGSGGWAEDRAKVLGLVRAGTPAGYFLDLLDEHSFGLLLASLLPAGGQK